MKKEPCFEDSSLMPFGKHRGLTLQETPAGYLLWLWNQADFQKDTRIDRVKLRNYIFNTMDALKEEAPDVIVQHLRQEESRGQSNLGF